MKKKILIADDEESIRFTFSSLLNEAGYLVDTADTLFSCLGKLAEEPFDLLILDIRFGREDGLGALQQIKDIAPNCPVVIITGDPSARTITKARQNGALDYLIKPIMPASLLYNVRKALTNHTSAC